MGSAGRAVGGAAHGAGANFDEHRCHRQGALRGFRICHPWPLAVARGSGVWSDNGAEKHYGEGGGALELQHEF